MREINKNFSEDFNRLCGDEVRGIVTDLNKNTALEFLTEISEHDRRRFVNKNILKDPTGREIGQSIKIQNSDFSDVTIETGFNYFRVSKNYVSDIGVRMVENYYLELTPTAIISTREIGAGTDRAKLVFISGRDKDEDEVFMEPSEVNTNVTTNELLFAECNVWLEEQRMLDRRYDLVGEKNDLMDFLRDFYNEHSNLVQLYTSKKMVNGKYLSRK